MDNIGKAYKLKLELDALRPLRREDEIRIMQKFRLDWNYHSNHIEGNTLTYGETKALILFGLTAQGKPLKDHFEISGHDEAIKWIIEIIRQDRPLTENFIRELHRLILKEPYEVDAITPEGNPTKKKIKIGEYKTTPNHVKTKTGEIFRFASPEETPALMHDLIDWYRAKTENKEFNPILVASEFHYRFIRIHPFDDGNGRTARLLMNFILMLFGYPPVIIKTEDKSNYFSVLRQADAGKLEPFIDYIGKNLVYSLEIMIKGAKGEGIEDPDDIDKEIILLEKKLKEVSQLVEISKSKDAILRIYDDSVLRLLTKFIEKGELLEKFYIKNEFHLLIDQGSLDKNKATTHKQSRTNIKDETKSVRPTFYYRAFNQIGLQEFNFQSFIEFHFDYTKYLVFNQGNELRLEKFYSEQLSDEEINNLVNTEIRRHKIAIEKMIDGLDVN